MQVTDETPRTEITIQGATFVAPEPYAEGHTLTANEAAAMNQLFHENLRNNFAAKVKAALESVGGAVDQLDQDSLQSEFDAYATSYEFGARRAGTRVPADPVGREAVKIARKMIADALKAKGIKKDQLPEGRYDEMLEQLAKREDVVASAKSVVEATKALSGIDLG